ncbi:sacsin N-terminal ATP-binding-like domain-containing protein [Flavobacterium sp. IB48]|uniref:sacsin N-terminal ATP-binding-like domain-containing protein n=1 Tax=Flavobacterium sp. IB48 TaxID=2779375 RepID=UPI0018E76660|nr:hypothetical protein [Flavobacterium sp. IB48]MBJ2126595.1 hypothetical protein [Flavobacterium sp. IB48]
MEKITEAQRKRELQRSDSEARDIIHDIDKLNTFPENKKSRWVWELLQNAKDVAAENGVDVIYELRDNQIIFSHNGTPFETEHLLAILYKTSTKSLGGDDGTTGKYGTGFVTTHILSRKIVINGVHRGEDLSFRRFSLDIDRTAAALDESEALEEMRKSLYNAFQQIDKIAENPSQHISDLFHSFTYSLSISSKKYAISGLEELEKNIPFVLLINKKEKKHINSVTIIRDGVKNVFQINPIQSSIDGLDYIEIGNNSGILYKELESIIFGLPVINHNGRYSLESIYGKSVLYKEFPLIGSENFHLPVFVQHKKFKPTEERDGIRTKKEDEKTADSTADNNRRHLKEFIDEYLKFISILIESNCNNLHHLALSGLPEFIEKYHNEDWYLENIQMPIRSLISEKAIVKNANGNFSPIKEIRFPIIDLATDGDFFELLEELMPNKVPSSESLNDWNKIINQEYHNWNDEVTISLEQLLEGLPNSIDLTNPETYRKLKKVYHFLESKNSKLGESYPIYLNEKNEFKTRLDVSQYPEIDDEIKFVSKQLGKDLDDEFLNKRLGKINDIKEFNLPDFYKSLNSDVISPLKIEDATDEKIKAILHINSLFKTDRATKRENWLDIIKELIPEKINEKKIISIDYENYHYPAELWTAKYLCWLIEKEVTLNSFNSTYFQDEDSAYNWLNKFINYISQSRDDIKGFLTKYKIIPVQDGNFVADSESIFKEDDSRYFDETLKSIVKDNCQFSVKSFLISNKLNILNYRKASVSIITDKIDNLFLDVNIQTKVSKDGELHQVFLEINSWFEKHSDASFYLKTFASKRNMLYVISLGDGFSKQIMALKESGKSMEDITELAKINLTTTEMQNLAHVANELGTAELLHKANELIKLRDQRVRWKQIGTSAEVAFKSVFEGLELNIELSNPDVGKDFELILKTNNYSIEIKNVIEGKEIVRMSILQGRTAVEQKENYALCVMTRPNDDIEISPEYFIEHAMFVTDIGTQIGDKIKNWDEGLISLLQNEDIKVNLDNKTETVYINRSIWKKGIPFGEFIKIIETLFANETH